MSKKYTQLKTFKSWRWGGLENKINEYLENHNGEIAWVENGTRFSFIQLISFGLISSKQRMIYFTMTK